MKQSKPGREVKEILIYVVGEEDGRKCYVPGVFCAEEYGGDIDAITVAAQLILSKTIDQFIHGGVDLPYSTEGRSSWVASSDTSRVPVEK